MYTWQTFYFKGTYICNPPILKTSNYDLSNIYKTMNENMGTVEYTTPGQLYKLAFIACILSVMFPGIQTHNLGVANAMR